MTSSLAMILQSLQLSPATHSAHSIASRSLLDAPIGTQEHFRSIEYSDTCANFSVSPVAQELPVPSFPAFDEEAASIFRYRDQRSVNLGSWFVQERWMTSSDFVCAVGHQDAELDVAFGWKSPANAKAVLEKHWDEFITEEDFIYLASIGINTVRLPIGFWNLGGSFTAGTPFEGTGDMFSGSWARIARAINWANTYGIGVLVDMHGAAGSQNGQSHSGVSDGNAKLFETESYMDKTISALVFMAQQLCGVTNVVGIQLLNEPTNHERLPEFYTKAINAMRGASPQGSSCPLYIHDGFDLDRFTDFVSARADFVVLDYHSYFVFTPRDSAEPASGHTSDIQSSLVGRLGHAYQRMRQNMIVGEWSCALTPQSLEGEQNHDAARRDFCTAQYEVYSANASGHHFWSYKLDHHDEGWSFTDAVGAKMIPQAFWAYPGSSGPLFPVLVDAVLPNIAPSLPVLAASIASPTHESGPVQHRALAIHLRRQGSTQEASFSQGYLDGFNTAKSFAKKKSRLGFQGQYILDRIQKLKSNGKELSGGEAQYEEGFRNGLAEAERLIEVL